MNLLSGNTDEWFVECEHDDEAIVFRDYCNKCKFVHHIITTHYCHTIFVKYNCDMEKLMPFVLGYRAGRSVTYQVNTAKMESEG